MPRGVNDYDAAKLQGRNVSNANSFSIVSPSIVTDGLAMYVDAGNFVSYPISGTNWTDLSGNGNNSVLTNGPTYNRENGGSIVFDGSDDVALSGTNVLSGLTAVSGCAWVYQTGTSSTQFPRLISKRGSGGVAGNGWWEFAFDYSINPNGIFVFQADYVTVDLVRRTTATMTANTWMMLSFTWTGGADYLADVKIYRNATEQTATGTSTNGTGGRAAETTNAFHIANTGVAARPFAGRVACTLMYNRALSPTEIEQNFNATRARFGV